MMETISPREKVLAAYVRAIGNRFVWSFRRAIAGDPGELFALLDRIVIRSAGVFQDEPFLRKVWRAIQWFATGPQRLSYLTALTAQVAQLAPNDSRYALLEAQLRFSLGELDRAFDIAVALSERGYRSAQLDCLLKVRNTSIAPTFPDFNTEKIFGIGLSKTGTTSLTEALNLLDYHTIHCFSPHTWRLISGDDFLRFDAFTDFPVAHCFETLYHTFPNAKFIYTTRNIRDWTESISALFYRLLGTSSTDDLRRTRGWLFPLMIEMNHGLYRQHPSWEAAYRAYDQRVRHFFRDKPANKLLELPICAGGGFTELCGFLGRTPPAGPFPYSNVRPEKTQTSSS